MRSDRTTPDPCPCETGVRRSTAYRRGCRHPHVRAAKNRHEKRRRAGHTRDPYTDSTGTARRLQALAAIGWPSQELAARTDIRHTHLSTLRWQRRPRVRRDTAAAVARLYDQLWDTPGPSRHMRERAAHHGWNVPLAWDDDTIDDPAARPNTGLKLAGRAAVADPVNVARVVSGHDPAADHDQVTVNAAIAALDRQGWASTRIAKWLGVPVRRVERHRARARATTPGKAA